MRNDIASKFLEVEIKRVLHEVHTDDMKSTIEIKSRVEALEMGQKALEKQIPKKPIEVPIIGGDDMVCPECLVFVESGAKYCSECGQALLWEEEDD